MVMNGSVIYPCLVLRSTPSLLRSQSWQWSWTSSTWTPFVSVCLSVCHSQGLDQVLKYSSVFHCFSSLCSGSCRYFVLLLPFKRVGNCYVYLISFLLIWASLVQSLVLLQHMIHHLFDFFLINGRVWSLTSN